MIKITVEPSSPDLKNVMFFFVTQVPKLLHTFNSQNQVTLLILQPDTHSDRDVSPTMGKVVKVDIAPDRRPSAYSNQVTAKTGQTGQTG